jgi:DNA-binding response OmpR family regulator
MQMGCRFPPFEAGAELALISALESDHSSLREIIARSPVCVKRFHTCEKALAFLREHSIGVVIANAELPDGGWRALLEDFSGLLPCPPNLIVSSRLADEILWAEVLNLGGYDLLQTPFVPEELVRVTNAAWRCWRERLREISTPRRSVRTDVHRSKKVPLGASNGS